MTKKQKDKARSAMAFNKVDTVYMTSDGNLFLNVNPAQNHALREHGNIRKNKLTLTKVTKDMVSDVDVKAKADAKIESDAKAKAKADAKIEVEIEAEIEAEVKAENTNKGKK